MDAWPELVLWVLYVAGGFSRGPILLYLFFIAQIFGGLSMIPSAAAGINVPAQATCGGFLIVKILLRSDNLVVAVRQALDVRKLGLLGFFAVYCIYTAFMFPRLFKGEVTLYALNNAKAPSKLFPVAANFDQLVYMLIAVGMTFAIAVASRSDEFRRHYFRATSWAAAAVILSGLIDLTFNAVHLSALLSPFHNATYRTLADAGIGGVHRVVGFMPEASGYGALCVTYLSYLVFNISAFAPAAQRRFIPPLILGLGAFSLLSTSSTAYFGLAVLGAVYLSRLYFGFVLTSVRSASRLRQVAYLAAGILAMAGIAVIIGPFVADKVTRVFDAVVIDKTSSSSYLERTRWTQAGIHAFFATHGIGVGIGSIRTSNWFVNIAASTGVLGVVLFFGFVARVAYRASTVRNPDDRRLANNLLLALIPYLGMTWISGTTPDPGAWAMATLGLAYGLRLRNQPAAARLDRRDLIAPGAVALNAGT